MLANVQRDSPTFRFTHTVGDLLLSRLSSLGIRPNWDQCFETLSSKMHGHGTRKWEFRFICTICTTKCTLSHARSRYKAAHQHLVPALVDSGRHSPTNAMYSAARLLRLESGVPSLHGLECQVAHQANAEELGA